MRLAILDRGHSFGTKALFALIATASRQPVLDAVKVVKYRPDFYGNQMSKVTQGVMRGPSSWSVGDRELMAAVIANANECEWCTQAHSAVAGQAYGDPALVASVLTNLEKAAINEPLRATLLMLRKLCREGSVSIDDMRGVLVAGSSRGQIEDALAVSFAFNTMARLADSFGFSLPTPKAFEAGAKYLLSRGYR